MSDETRNETIREQDIQHGSNDNPHNDAETGAALGGIGGAAIGAAAGSAAGPAGAVIGAIVGGVVGAAASGVAVAAVDSVDNDNSVRGIEPDTGTVKYEEVETLGGPAEIEGRAYVDDDIEDSSLKAANLNETVTVGDYDAVETYENRTYEADLSNWSGSESERKFHETAEETAEGLSRGRFDEATGRPLD